MKKKTFLLAFIALLMSTSIAYSLEVKGSDYEIFEDNTPAIEQKIVNEHENIIIYTENDKYGIKDKTTGKELLKAQWDIITPLDTNYNEFKLKKDNKAGYANIELNTMFITPFDDLSICGNYIKVKNNGLYGLTDKQGNIILPPAYQRVGVFTNQDVEYITGKIDGKYKFYQNTGVLIPEEELYTITYDKETALLANDIRPIFNLKTVHNAPVYQLNQAQDNLAYEIKEMEMPSKVKVVFTADNKVIPVSNQNINLKEKNNEIVTIKNKDYKLIKDNNKVGLINRKGVEILAAEYNSIRLEKPCKHFLKPIIVAEKNNSHYLYELNGRLMAEESNGIIYVYRDGNIYLYENGILSVDNKEIGRLEKVDNGYKYKKTKFSLFTPHKVIELILTVLPIEK